jgi:MFS family permease
MAGLLLNIYNGALLFYGWSGFINPILATFGWTMVQLSLAGSLRGLESGVFTPLFGWVIDHFSARKLMIIGLIVNAGGMFMVSQTKNLGMFYGGFLIMGLGGSMSWIVPTTVLTRWFKKDLGKANGIFVMGNGIGGIAAPLVVKIIDTIGWQTTLMYGAIGLLAIGIPVALIFRDRPQDYNMLPDGATTVSSDATMNIKVKPEFGTNVKDALKMRAFWHLGLIILFQSVVLSVVGTFSIPYLTDEGMSRPAAATVTSLFTLVSLFTRIPFGIMSDVIKKSYCVALSICLLTIGVFIFWLLGGSSPFWMVVTFAVFYGIGLSGIVVLQPPILAEYFGTKNFGTIFALQNIFSMIGGITSQPLAGWVFDTYHTYKPLLLGVSIFGLVALTVILTIPKASTDMKSSSKVV